MKKIKNDLFDYEELSIIQNDTSFKFSLDSILLAEFVNILPTTKKIVDFCTGNAPIPMILSTKTNANIIGIEIQKDISDLAKLSIVENKLSIEIINDNLNKALNYIEGSSVDIITCNPPYFKFNSSSLTNNERSKSIARHEIETNIDEIIDTAFDILKDHGSLYLVHRPERLVEIMEKLNSKSFEIKRLQFVYSKEGKDAIILLIKATKKGKKGLKVLPPVFIEGLKSYKNIF